MKFNLLLVFALLSLISIKSFSEAPVASQNEQEAGSLNLVYAGATLRSEKIESSVELVRQDLQRRGLLNNRRGLVMLSSNNCAPGRYNVALLAADAIQEAQNRPDLVKHAKAGSIIATGAAMFLDELRCANVGIGMTPYLSKTLGFLFACGVGVAKEARDKMSKKGNPEYVDAEATCLGGAAIFAPIIDISF